MQITWEDLKAAEEAVGEFGGDNRAGVQGTLHRISALRNRKGTVVGLTCRVGRAVTGHMDMIRDMIEGGRCCVQLAAWCTSEQLWHRLLLHRREPACVQRHLDFSCSDMACGCLQCRTRSCSWADPGWGRPRSSGRWRGCCRTTSTNEWSS